MQGAGQPGERFHRAAGDQQDQQQRDAGCGIEPEEAPQQGFGCHGSVSVELDDGPILPVAARRGD
jgi:hypothetical protein